MQKKIPTRKCVGCGEMKDKRELVRVIKTPEDEICLDTTGRANGRGAYICNNAECLKKALKNKGLERSLKAQIPEDVLDKLSKEFGE
ncbi:YlxR family protein [Butyrivibrio sp. X503]|uniref:RNase P modulator RnpM n=1 Tax=Butyrivibrio sp. X503 TaxID=2364878 RepID=UPI000EA99D2F|nr:YlxR family protein [Butyrivibrio sp. X503]RKM55524.1 YlxR family protein [Butyrivibrio sp. X503]